MFSLFRRRWLLVGSIPKVRGKRRSKRPGKQPFLEPLETREVLTTALPLYIVHHPPPDGAPGTSPQAGPGPGGYTPSQIVQAYGFNQISFTSNGTTVPGNGQNQTIAIVDAYNAPTISGDLQTFDQKFGLPNPKLTVLNENGGTSLPGADPSGDWEVEESLDVEWAHAIAPAADILLVEASSPSIDDLVTAVQTAASRSGVVAVSMSWGGGEFAGENSFDNAFTTPQGHTGVVFSAASGDSGAPPIYPSVSPNVMSVGGTSLFVDSNNNWQSESGWSGSGGGVSSFESAPSYQPFSITQSNQRTSPDVAYDADPSTGYAIYDSTPAQGFPTGWGGACK